MMTESIRVLHFADVHIGMENYGRIDPETGLSSRVRDFLRRMDEMIEYAREHDVDLTLFAGDAFKTRTPNPTFQREFAWRVRELINLAPLVLLVGNHDLPLTAMKASSIEIYDTLAVPNVWVAANYETKIVETKRGSVVVATVPYPIRSLILENEDTSGMTIAEIDHLLERQLMRTIETLAEQADEHDLPRILTGHFTVNGAAWGSERGIMLGRDVQVMPSVLADPRWDYVALGHIHKFQNLTAGRDGAPPVVYSGSIERIDFGEESDTKGFCWVEIQRQQVDWRFVPLKARPFITLTLDLRQSEDPTQETVDLIAEHRLEGAIVRLILDLTPETEARLNEGIVRDALWQAGVNYIAAIRKEVEQPARARLGGSPEGLSDMELLERYLISRQFPPERQAQLIQEAEKVFEVAAAQESAAP
jgi:exonuclease SbcD